MTVHDETRGELSSLKVQVPTWMAVAFLAIAVICTTWAWATGDAVAGLIGTGSLALFAALALMLDKLVRRHFQDRPSPKGTK